MSHLPDDSEPLEDPTKGMSPETRMPDWAAHAQHPGLDDLSTIDTAADSTDPAFGPRPPAPPTTIPSGEEGRRSASAGSFGDETSPIGSFHGCSIAPGQVLFGRYRVVRLLGRGGMGAVWLVRHVELDCERALKVISAGHEADSQARDWFRREAKILARVSEHRHAVTVHDARLTASDLAYIDMEYVRGRSLNEVLVKGTPMPLDWTLRIITQLCEALQFAHDNQVLHRDLKPSNLMLVDGYAPGQEQLKVLDFGIGKILNAEDREDLPHTLTGAFVGTPPYTSPEQAVGEAVPASDLYSVGVILYEFLTGHRPFRGTAALMIHQTISTAPPPFREVNPAVAIPAEIEAVVQRCLAKNPEDRPPSARALIEELREAHARGTPTEVMSIPPGFVRGPNTRQASARRPAKRALIAVAALALVAAGGGLLWLKLAPGRVDQGSPDDRPPGAGAPVDGAGTPVATATDPTPAGTPKITAPPVEGTAPVAIAFDPPDAEVEIDGRPASPDQAGRLPLDAVQFPIRVTARSEDYTPFSGTLTRADLEKSGFKVTLARPPGVDAMLADRAIQLLEGRCRRCHGIELRGRAFDVLDRAGLVRPPARGIGPLIAVGDPAGSPLYRVATGGHPATKTIELVGGEDEKLLRRWIRSGSPFPEPPARSLVTPRQEIEAVAAHLRSLPEADRPHYRYFSLAAVDNRRLPAEAHRIAAYGLAKAINALSWGAELVIPKPIDATGTILAVDLRPLGWDAAGAGAEIARAYPYAMAPRPDDPGAGGPPADLAAPAGAELPLVRADWFIATAMRPPLYPALLKLPETSGELEARLEVSPRADFLDNQLTRYASVGGRYTRGPSIIDDHSTALRVFWKSYHGNAEPGATDAYDTPLGPSFPDHPFPREAFREQVASILFSLPNGLPGFMLADGSGRRIDALPEGQGLDAREATGSPRIVAGLSCIGCHRIGVERFQDVLAEKSKLSGPARAKLAKIGPRPGDLEEAFASQEQRFLAAMDPLIGPDAEEGGSRKASARDLPEPIASVARSYARGLDAGDLAAELGLADPQALVRDLRGAGLLDAAGWEALGSGGTVPRDVWERDHGRVIAALKLGSPAPTRGE